MKTRARSELARFRIGTDWSGRRRSVMVVVYDSRKAMVEAALRFHPGGLVNDATYARSHAVVQTQLRIEVRPDGSDKEASDIGFIRLYRGALGVGLLSHECTHVVATIFYRDVSKRFPNRETTDGAAWREEQLAYMVGDLTTQLVAALYRRRKLRKK